MKKALQLAQRAASEEEVPIGAVIVDHQGQLLGEGFNRCIGSCDPTAHAEIVAIRSASQQLQNYRLTGATLYVTLQPCLMCLMAALHARIRAIRFGAFSQKNWPLFSETEKEALWSVWNPPPSPSPEEALEEIRIGDLILQGGLNKEQSAALMQSFFIGRRRQHD